MSTTDYDSELGWSESSWSGVSETNNYGENIEDLAQLSRRIELMDITEKERPFGDRPMIIPTSAFNQAKDVDKKYTEYALLIRRKVDKEGNRMGTSLEVWSPIIRAALRETLDGCSYLNTVACPIIIAQPYHALFHYRKEIREYVQSTERTEEEKKHLELLTNFMSTNLIRMEREYEQYAPNGLTTFNLLWTLFRPETLVVLQKDHFRECFRVENCKETVENGVLFFTISVWSWSYNGISFGPTKSQLSITEFVGPQRITSLSVCPLWALPDKDRQELETSLRERGKKWRMLVDHSHRQYVGPAWIDRIGDAKDTESLVLIHVNGRIYLDYKSHEESNYSLSTILYTQNGIVRNKRPEPIRSSYLPYPTFPPPQSPNEQNQITEEDLSTLNKMRCHPNNKDYEMTDYEALLCPARIRGFAFAEKKWAFFLVENVDDISWSEGAFTTLEADPTIKDNIQALVESHNIDPDVYGQVSKKGKGLVVVLHGPPGTGKTLTAESIADFTHKPLYYIGAGELGMEVNVTERQLQRILTLAKSWNAIVLLDEADVFLAKRTSDDMARNAFVAVFLRLLEYFEGIIFLTTNRIEEFDPAFESRVHLRLSYQELDEKKRTNIWRNLLQDGQSAKHWREEDFAELGRDLPINGREINNLLRTGSAIARHKKIPLTKSSLIALYNLNFTHKPLK